MADTSMQRKLRAIFSADVKGYSKLMGEDDEHTINTITAYRKIIADLIEANNGRVVDAHGDNILAEFSGALNAVKSAIEVQQKLETENSELPENRRMDFRIGINLGDIIHRGDRIYGDGVNVAARIENLADPGGICISRGVFDQVKRKVRNGFEYLGEHIVKNIPEPVRIYRILLAPEYEGKIIGEPVRRSAKINMPGAITIVIILLCSIGLLWVYYPRPSDIDPASLDKMAHPLPEGPSIAVLPFANLSGDNAQDYFSDGITEQIITSLSNVPYLYVIARNSTFTYKGKSVKVQQVAEDLGVRFVLEGSVQRSGDRLRINAQLIDAIAGHHLWAEYYDQTLGDIFFIQDQIAMKIMAALQIKLSIADFGKLSAIKTENLKAYEKLLQAREALLRRTEADIDLSRQLAKEAIDLDPEYGAAYLQLAYTHLDDVWFYKTQSREVSLNTAEQLGYKAIRFSGEGADTHRLFSIIYLLRRQYDEAVTEGRKAIALSPNSARTLFMFGMVLRFAGFYDEAIQNLEKAIRLDPITTVNYLHNLAWAYAYSMKYDKAVSLWTKAIRKNPDYLFAHMGLAASYQLSGNDQKAKEHAANLIRIKPELSLARIKKSFFTNDETGTKRIQEALRLAGVPEHPPKQEPEEPSVAVLPFENMSGDPDQQYFSDGITEQIITSISKVPYISVIARQSSFAFRNSEKTIQQIAKALGVRFILEGSVQRSGDQLRINTQLIDAASGNHIWADSYDREINDIFVVQDEICMNVMVALQVKLTAGEAARIAAETTNIKAYESFLKGMEKYLSYTDENLIIAKQLFRETINLDPRYALAYVMVGWIHLEDVWRGRTQTPAKSIAKAEDLARKAISIHGVTTNEYALLAGVHVLKRDYDQALAYGEKAVEQCPNCAGAQQLLGSALRYKGQYKSAILRIKKAIQLEPIKNITYLGNLAWCYLYSKQYEQAIATWNEILARNKDSLYAYMGLTAAYWWSGSEDQARIAARQVLRVNPQFSVGYYEKLNLLTDEELKQKLFNSWRLAGLK